MDVGASDGELWCFFSKAARAGLLLVLVGAVFPSVAQDASPSGSGGGVQKNEHVTSDERQRNGFAENLKSKAKRSPMALNQPYTPIRKEDDQSQIPEIEMFVGESRVFPAPGVARIAVGNGQILTAAALDNKEVLIFANGVGTSSLFVWNEDGRYQRVKINIVAGDTTRIAREVAAFLTAIPHTKASIVGDKVIVEGDGLSDSDLQKIEMLEKRYPQIINFTNRIGWEKMVMMDVKVVEFPKNELYEFGLKWSAMGGAVIGGIWKPMAHGSGGGYGVNIPAGGAGLPVVNADGSTTGIPLPIKLGVTSGVNLGLGAQLNVLDQTGKASVLAEPQLSARSGSKASFLAGGEFPYSVATVSGVTIMFKPYGIKLEVEPKVDRNGVIRASIDAEVSKIDASISTSAGPALLTRKTRTEFNVRDGETIVLAGLIKRDASNNVDKVPLLGDIPVLGALFRSKRFQNDETELVVFVTPTVVDTHSPGLVDRVERATARLQKELGAPPYLSAPLQPNHDPARTNEPGAAATSATTEEGENGGAQGPALSAQPTAMEAGAPNAPTPVAAMAPLVAASANPLAHASPSPRGSTLRVNKDGLVIRAQPGVKNEALLQLGYGSVVQLGGQDLQMAGGMYWRNVIVGRYNGWVIAEGVEPSHQLPHIKPYKKSAISSADQGGNPLALGANAKGKGVSPGAMRTATAAAGDAAGVAPLPRFRVTLERLAMRVTPDVNAPVVQNLAEGQVVDALPQTPHNNWTAVQFEGKSGWVATQWLHPLTAQQ
ncbi:MAG: pilus assembly protein N-terminal domain-containing protein [Rhodoferax sp.]